MRNTETSVAIAVEIAPYMATALRLRFGTHSKAGSAAFEAMRSQLTGLDHDPAATTAKAKGA